MFSDAEVVALLKDKFNTAASATILPSEKVLSSARIGEQDNPFPFPHTDSTIYKRKIFVGSRKGVFSAGCCGRTKKPVSTRTRKHWDAPTTGISAAWSAMALAAGSDGLFEMPQVEAPRRDPQQVSSKHASSCEWVFWSIYASSHVSGGYLAEYSRPVRESAALDANGDEILEPPGMPSPNYDRAFEDVRSATEIFGGPVEYTWGSRDKICATDHGHLDVRRYQPWSKHDPKIQALGKVKSSGVEQPDRLVSARTASFGIIFERDDELVVVDSTSKEHSLPGAPVNWRIFPRSRRYENHLHVIYDDYLEILSFNHDYFVDQNQKLLGTRL